MPYVLGIHLGATATSAAVAQRDGSKWAAAVPVPLGGGGPRATATVPTVLCKVQDGSFVAGEPARSQELSHHEWVVRCFTRRVGDDAPMLVGTEFVTAQRLIAKMVEWVADTVAHQQRHPPEHIAVAHSTTWGPYRIHLVQQALGELGLTDVTLVPEPVAVGLDYASKQQIADNAVLAVGNIGGSGFDATVLRRRRPGFEVVGQPLDSAHPSGQDLDDEVLAFLRSSIEAQWDALDPSDVRVRAALTQLRAECTRVKETLSYQPEASLRVEIPGVQTQLRLSRAKYEHLVRTHLERVPELLSQAIQSATLSPDQLEGVVLAGGTARTPLLKQLVGERLDLTPLVDAVPELVGARGAALAAVSAVSPDTDMAVSAAETSVMMRIEGPDSDEFDRPGVEEAEAPRPPIEVEPMYIEPPDERRELIFKIVKLSLAALLILLGLWLTIHPPAGNQPRPGVLTSQN